MALVAAPVRQPVAHAAPESAPAWRQVKLLDTSTAPPSVVYEWAREVPVPAAYSDRLRPQPDRLMDLLRIVPATRHEQEPQDSLDPGTVLVIDDEPEICAVVRDALENEGYGVTCHTRGDEGLQAAQAEAPDVVILDWRLAGDVSGEDVLERLLDDTGTCESAVLLITASPGVVHGRVQFEEGRIELLAKPFDIGELYAAVARLILSP
jgi:CheY-like chemotaxis protein